MDNASGTLATQTPHQLNAVFMQAYSMINENSVPPTKTTPSYSLSCAVPFPPLFPEFSDE